MEGEEETSGVDEVCSAPVLESRSIGGDVDFKKRFFWKLLAWFILGLSQVEEESSSSPCPSEAVSVGSASIPST